VIGLGLFAYLFVFFTQAAGKVAVWRTSATSQTTVHILPDSSVVFRIFQNVDSSDYVGTIPAAGDTLVSLADSAATPERWNAYMDAPMRPGTLVPAEYLHNSEIRRTLIRLRLPTTAEFWLVSSLQSLRFLIALFFMSVALWAFFARPDSAAVRALALFSFAMTAMMISNVEVLSNRWAIFQIPYAQMIRMGLNFLAVCFAGFWLNLAMLFPRPNRLMQTRPWLAHFLCYGLTVLVIIAGTIGRRYFPLEDINVFIQVTMTSQIIGGVILLAVAYRRADTRVQKRQARLVLWGTGVGLAALVGITAVSQIFQTWFLADSKRTLAVVNVAFLALLLSPISYAYALGRYRLLDVEARLRRGTRYVIAMGSLIGVLAFLAWAGSSFANRVTAVGSFWGVAILCVLALALISGARRARIMIVDRFYPERRRLRRLLEDFLQTTSTMMDTRTFWLQIEEHLRDGLMVDGVYPLVRSRENGAFLCFAAEGTPFHADGDLAARLERERKPIMVDEAVASAKVRLTDEESNWLAERRIALLLPLLVHAQLVGFLGLGVKTEEEDYAAEELRLLDSLAPQVALAGENIRLLEENVGKKRLEEQLEMARKVQNGFLPHLIPNCPRLELAARCHFCLEVAGDYYDIIPVENGCTVFAVGDVSGKGAGAAMLMANLQASLRTAAGMGIPLANLVSRINELIYRNTPPEQFITFFVAMFDPARMTLTYVNAGHNPPMLLRSGGQLETLDEGGLLLGVFTSIAYREATLSVSEGDVLLLYTDGVSEAMNETEDEFGEDRLRTSLEESRSASPQAILERIEDAVLTHHGSVALEDDFTLLLARIH
jgi:sigma-B regulation protein RsbU (phosphoserine phosphatase)